MKRFERLSGALPWVVFGVVAGWVPQAVADQQTSIAGRQVMVARFTNRPVVINGVLDPAEWSAAIPVHVQSNTPATAPGVVPSGPDYPFLFPPDNEDDSSFTIYAMYDNDNLYIAVDVADDFLYGDSVLPWEDDDVEVYIDGDRQPGDVVHGLFCPVLPFCADPVVNNEGFQIITSVAGARVTQPPNNPAIVWESAVGLRPRGFLVEFRIPLDSINTHDTSPWTGGTPGFRRPGPGDTIGFNVAVGDDDNGGASYNDGGARTDSFTAWDGSSKNWNNWGEPDWGSLYLLPH